MIWRIWHILLATLVALFLFDHLIVNKVVPLFIARLLLYWVNGVWDMSFAVLRRRGMEWLAFLDALGRDQILRCVALRVSRIKNKEPVLWIKSILSFLLALEEGVVFLIIVDGLSFRDDIGFALGSLLHIPTFNFTFTEKFLFWVQEAFLHFLFHLNRLVVLLWCITSWLWLVIFDRVFSKKDLHRHLREVLLLSRFLVVTMLTLHLEASKLPLSSLFLSIDIPLWENFFFQRFVYRGRMLLLYLHWWFFLRLLLSYDQFNFSEGPFYGLMRVASI